MALPLNPNGRKSGSLSKSELTLLIRIILDVLAIVVSFVHATLAPPIPRAARPALVFFTNDRLDSGEMSDFLVDLFNGF